MLNIQRIMVDWGKKARGGKGAAIRNSVPEALPISEEPSYYEDYGNGISVRHDFYNYMPKQSEQFIFESGGAFCELEEDRLGIYWFGPPSHHVKKLIELDPNTWVRVIYNYRYTTHESWGYRKIVLNIHFGDPFTLTDSFFVDSSPIAIIDKRRLL